MRYNVFELSQCDNYDDKGKPITGIVVYTSETPVASFERECDYKDFIKDKEDLFVVDMKEGVIVKSASTIIDD